jgi:hypothetical protein
MNELGLFFVGVGLLFALCLSTAARYPDSGPDGQRLVRYVAAPSLAVLGILIFHGITLQ